MTAATEFSRPIRLDRIGGGRSHHAIEADAAERAALAARFGLIAIERLTAEFELSREGEVVTATGRLSGAVAQACVATGEPVPEAIESEVALRFVPEAGEPSEEIELDVEQLDTIDYRGGAIDLGEAAAESLALALDPFPRSPEATEALKAAGVLSEEEARAANSPFAALKGLKDG